MEAPPPRPRRERLSHSHYLLFIWCLLERWYCSDRKQVCGWEACSLQDGRKGGAGSQGAPGGEDRPPRPGRPSPCSVPPFVFPRASR